MKKGEEELSVKLGNLLPGDDAVVNIEIIKELDIEGGALAFKLPLFFMPNYSKHDLYGTNPTETSYTFGYELTVVPPAGRKIQYLSNPSGTERLEDPMTQSVTIKQAPTQKYPKRDIRVFYRYANMGEPVFLYQENPEYADEVACQFSFLPNFEPLQPQEMCEDDVPEATKIEAGKDFLFVFLVDCSGSMAGHRINVTKEALKFFIQSLPVDSNFAICQFGTKNAYIKNGKNQSPVWVYNDNS